MIRIIALWGRAGCGKTTTINYVREMMREAGAESLSAIPDRKEDERETFRFRGKVVCVCPGGDNKRVVEENFQYAIRKQADVIITGCRSKGSPVWTVKQYEDELNAKLRWVEKNYEYELSEATQELCNKKTAEVIFQKVIQS